MKIAITAASASLLTLLLAGAGIWLYLRHTAKGFSARATPSQIEASLAQAARNAATPAAIRDLRSPITPSPEMHEAMAHYADHCAICHANNGSGDTMLGNGMYPRPPDMRLAATQTRTDGELFSIIENGIRMSGMPGFGGNPANEPDSWKLVLFIRHLPHLTPGEQSAMESLNPKGPDEIDEEKQEADFLNGSDATSAPSKKTLPPAK